MANRNSIQILRGTSDARANHTEVSLIGQPLFETDTNKLYVGDGTTPLNELNAIVASHAETANHATSADGASSATRATTASTANRVRNNLSFIQDGSTSRWNGSSACSIYVPTAVGSIGQVWGVKSSGNVGWINQTEIPGTIEHANTADHANTASTLNQILPANLGGTGTNALNKALADMIQESSTTASINDNCYFPIATNSASTSYRVSYKQLQDAFAPVAPVGRYPRILGIAEGDEEVAIMSYLLANNIIFVDSVVGSEARIKLHSQAQHGDRDIDRSGQRFIIYRSGPNNNLGITILTTSGELSSQGITESLTNYTAATVSAKTGCRLLVTLYA